uniref:mavicyanin-like n=1 Tax=Erigeron canadensis TaxID=72917 RepID=UPI001CB8990A|nr:mavicyanin-like [Erigeron canadensis]
MVKVSIMRMLMGFAATAMLLQLAAAVDHSVGSSGGWDLSVDYDSWASSQTFSVGDNLVFSYDSSHDVLEVTKPNYDSCGTQSPISTSVNSPTRIPLTAEGSRYFICGRGSHCSQGMKVQINVVAGASGPPSPTPPTDGPSSNPSPPPPTTSISSPPPPTPSSAINLKTTGSKLAFGLLALAQILL